MKKVFFISILAVFFFATESMAQIQRNFLGMKLGVSTRQEVIKVIKQKELKMNHIEENSFFATGSILFGGNNWNNIQVVFQNDILCSIHFINIATYPYYEREILENTWETLYIKLRGKYSRYITNENTEKKSVYFQDGKTNILLHYIPAQTALTLSYIDERMYDAQSKKNDEEL